EPAAARLDGRVPSSSLRTPYEKAAARVPPPENDSATMTSSSLEGISGPSSAADPASTSGRLTGSLCTTAQPLSATQTATPAITPNIRIGGTPRPMLIEDPIDAGQAGRCGGIATRSLWLTRQQVDRDHVPLRLQAALRRRLFRLAVPIAGIFG